MFFVSTAPATDLRPQESRPSFKTCCFGTEDNDLHLTAAVELQGACAMILQSKRARSKACFQHRILRRIYWGEARAAQQFLRQLKHCGVDRHQPIVPWNVIAMRDYG